MSNDLTTSTIDRQNVLNNPYALEKIQEHLGIGGITWQGDILLTKVQVVRLLGVDERTVERYLTSHEQELVTNGYRVLRGKSLKELKNSFGTDIDVGTKTTVLGVFSFRAFLNLAMLLTESEKARAIRSRILDIVIDVIAERSGGHTQFINQRDEAFLPAAYQEFSYREVFTHALRDYLDMGNFKYGVYTNKVYKAVFHEDAKEYRQILKLAEKENPRDSMYAEVLQAIASIENGLAHEMKTRSEELGRKLRPKELDEIIAQIEHNPYLKPTMEQARTRMASRDLCFRDALHEKLQAYVQAVPATDFERFMGETGKALEERLSDPETLAVFKRLKDR
ncbi:MAG: hypothetical protein ACR2PX_07495 [Endozoicomonas sp.]|uniref:hypothetical protein n=1 Tax=Endozoicomonas sp. TaxID=1892382 RepID=UPI003D9B6382